MAIDIEWTTGEIKIPKADLTLISGDFFKIDTNALRKEIMDKYAAEEGGPWPTPFTHIGEVTIAGATQARTILLAGAYYFITFEALGNYRVRLDGSNNDLFTFATINGVSIEPTNSFGLITVSSGSGLDAAQDAKLTGIFSELDSIEGGFGHAELMRGLTAIMAGLLSGAPAGPIVFKAINGTTTRLEYTVDNDGNRLTVVTRNLAP